MRWGGGDGVFWGLVVLVVTVGGWGHQLGLYGLRDQALQLHSNSHPLCLCQCTTIKGDGNWIDEIRGGGRGVREEDVNY